MADNVQNIKLGITQEQFVQRTHDHLETLYEASGQAQLTAANALTVAQGKSLSISKESLDTMISYLKGLESGELSVGDNIFITQTDVPDFWISGVSTTYNNTNTIQVLLANDYNNTQFGYYTVSKLETQKIIVDDTDSVKSISINEGTPIRPDADGNVNLTVAVDVPGIDIDPLESGYQAKTTESTQIDVNGTSYYAIKLSDTDTVVEVFNSNGQSILYQTVRKNGYLYICVGEAGTYYIRTMDGNAVSNDTSILESRVETVEVSIRKLMAVIERTYSNTVSAQTNFKDSMIFNYDPFELRFEVTDVPTTQPLGGDTWVLKEVTNMAFFVGSTLDGPDYGEYVEYNCSVGIVDRNDRLITIRFADISSKPSIWNEKTVTIEYDATYITSSLI